MKNSTLSKVSIYGDVTLVYDKAYMSAIISIIGASRDTVVEDCCVNVKLDYDSSKSISYEEMKQTFDQPWDIEFGILGHVSAHSFLTINNFYSNATYTDSLKEFAKFIDTNKINHAFILKYLWSDKEEGIGSIFYDTERFPEITTYSDNYSSVIEFHTLSNDGKYAKSTADMKLQSTYTGFDFDNVWAISDKVNDGYPFILAEAVKEVNKLIADLPAKITADQKAAVEAARAAYDALSDSQKLQVSDDTLKKLTDAEAALKPAETKPAAAVKKGDKFVVGANRYQALSAKTAAFIGTRKKTVKKVGIPASVTYKNQKLTVTAIGKGACKGYKKLKAVTIGKNVTIIGAKAFAGDSKLKKIKVQSPVLKKVGAKAFKGINKKAVIKVPKKQRKKYKKLMKGKGQKKTVKIK